MGKFDRTPWAAGFPDYKYGTSSATPLLGRLASDAGDEEREAEYNKVLRPVLDFLLLAAVLLPSKLWWDLAEEQCWDPSSYKATELTLLRVTRGVWIAWLTHAAGLIDEALRVFLGIRLTMGLGSPTSVDKTYTKMSRRTEMVAEGIAVDDFPALMGLYAGARPPSANKRASSGTVRRGGGGSGGGSGGGGIGDDVTSDKAGLAAARARVNRSLVMRVEKIAATAQLWSLVPWSSVRRYDRVHVKGITLRLKQVKGILNFSFVALNKKGRGGAAGTGPGVGAVPPATGVGDDGGGGGGSSGSGPNDNGRRHPSSGGGVGGWGGFAGAAAAAAVAAASSGSMEDLDGIDTDGEYTTDTEDLDDDDDDSSYELLEEAELAAAADRTDAYDAPELVRQRSRSSSTAATTEEPAFRSQSATTLGGSLGGAARKTLAPWATARAGSSGEGGGGGGGPTAPGERARSMSLSVRSKRSTLRPSSSSENLGNLGVFKVLGEAFMRRFHAYSDQVSAAFDRVSDIKVVPSLWRWGRRRGGPRKRKKRFEVGEIFLEDVCICVDAGVWNDLLGDQVGAAFSPEFRLSVNVGPKELLTANGKGRLAGEIGKLVNDKLVRLLSRLVMRETLKTSTLTSVVIASLALDTDARGRRQGRHNKSLSPPPVQGGEAGPGAERGSLPRSKPFTWGSTSSEIGDFSSSASTAAASEHKPGKFWRPFATHSSSSAGAAAAAAAAEARGTMSVSASAGLPRSSSGGALGVKGHAQHGGSGGGRRRKLHPSSSSDGSFNPDSTWSGFSSEDGGIWDTGGGVGGDGGRGQRAQRSKRSLPTIGTWRRSSEPASSAVLGKGGLSPPPPPPPPRSRVRQRPRSGSSGGSGALAGADGDRGEDDGARSWLSGGSRRVVRERRGTVSDIDVPEDGSGGEEDSGGEFFETVAKVPPWMEGVEASAEYEEMKPTLDVIKRTVLLAMLQQTNRSVDLTAPFLDQGDINAKQNSRSWGRRQTARSKSGEEMLVGENKTLEQRMERELIAAQEAGGDVDRLVMKKLLAGVRDSGPNTAYKALASIELSSFIDNLSHGTRFAQHLENLGIDVTRVSRSLEGLTAGEMMEGVKESGGKVRGEARRLRTEAARVQKELLDETGILPLLDDAGGGNDATSLASAVGQLSEALTGENHSGSGSSGSGSRGSGGVGGGGEGGSTQSWERGVAVPNDPEEEAHSVESGLRSKGGGGDAEEVDQVDVIMQVLDLIDAVERLKKGIVEGGVSLGQVEQAVGKVASGIDVYLILAASESMLGFLLERLGKLPVGHAKFAGKGVEARVWNLDLEGVHVRRENVDLVMKGFRLPKRGTPVMTEFGRGKIKRYKKRSRCFVVNLDWRMGSGKPVKAYLQPNDIEILEGHEGGLSEEEEMKENGHTKVTVDSSEAEPTAAASSGAPPEASKGGGGGGSVGANAYYSSPTLREHSGSTSSSAPSLPPRSEKIGRWPSLSKIWNRRKSVGAATTAAAGPDTPRGLREKGQRSAGDGQAGSDRTLPRRAMAGRTASAPAMVGTTTPPSSPSSTRAREGSGALSSSLDDLACTRVVETETLGELHPIGFAVPAAAVGDSNSAGEARASGTPIATPSVHLYGRRRSESGFDAGEEGEEGDGAGSRYLRQRSSSQGSITGPNPADVMSAPFLVARISGVGAELKDIMWSVRQTHFPHLKTAGSLQATLSGLTIELELDTQDLPAERGKKHRGSGVTASEGLSDGGNDSSGSGGSGSGGSGGPVGLKLTRLRVSVLAVKVHVKNNALSAVYNLAASAFEAAVKRYVVDNVEAAVRRNVTSLLTIVNTQLSQKWDVLCKVGGGGGGGGNGRENGESPRPGSAVEKVLATSLSHHLVWPAGDDGQARGGSGGGGSDGGGGAAAAGPNGVKRDSVSDQRPTLERVASGSSRGSMDSEDSGGGGGGGGSGTSSAATATSVRKRLAKRSFRILGSVGRAQSTEELSKLSSTSSAASTQTTASSSSSSVPPPPPASRRTSNFARPPPSPTPPSQNSSSTTLSEGEASLTPQAELAGRWVQDRRRELAAAGSEKRLPSMSPPSRNRRQPSGLRGTTRGSGEGSAGGVFSDGGAEEYWKTSPTGSATLRRSPELSVPVVDG